MPEHANGSVVEKVGDRVNVGLLMINGENDILERTLAANCEFVDCFYALDGTTPNEHSKAIVTAHPKCEGYVTDDEVAGERFGPLPRDGWRQFLYEQASAAYGRDNWFLLLHGDEVWTGLPDNMDDHDGFMFSLPVYFPRAGEPWNPNVHPLDQLRWHLGPGYREFRMFKGGDHVNYEPQQHFNVTPSGIHRVGGCDKPIKHYPYRAPELQRERAARHQQTGFDPGNYQHITDDDAVYWDDQRIEGVQTAYVCFRELAHAV